MTVTSVPTQPESPDILLDSGGGGGGGGSSGGGGTMSAPYGRKPRHSLPPLLELARYLMRSTHNLHRNPGQPGSVKPVRLWTRSVCEFVQERDGLFSGIVFVLVLDHAGHVRQPDSGLVSELVHQAVVMGGEQAAAAGAQQLTQHRRGDRRAVKCGGAATWTQTQTG